MDYEELLAMGGETEYEPLSENDDCPRCEDGKLIKRYNRSFGGGEFLGCSNYPKCNFTKNNY